MRLEVRPGDTERLVFEHRCPRCKRHVSLRLHAEAGSEVKPRLRCQMCAQFDELGTYTRVDGKVWAVFEDLISGGVKCGRCGGIEYDSKNTEKGFCGRCNDWTS